MPRTVRVNDPGNVYHLISRFVDRDWFITARFERAMYLRFLGRALDSSDWKCISYAVMSNHIHLAMVAGHQKLGPLMRDANGCFAQWLNRRHDRIGSVFVRGPTDILIPPDRVRNVVAYIHNNPVRARVAPKASASDWTSHRAYVGLADVPRWLDIAEGRARCELPTPEFDRWVDGDDSQLPMPDLDPFQRQARRRGALALGTPTFGDEIEVPLVKAPWARVLPDPREIVELVAATLSVMTSELAARTKAKPIVRGKRMALWCGQRVGLSITDVSRALGMSQQAASKLTRASLDASALAECARIVERVNAGTGIDTTVDHPVLG